MKMNFRFFNEEWNEDTKPPSDDDVGTRGRVPKDLFKVVNELITTMKKTTNGN